MKRILSIIVLLMFCIIIFTGCSKKTTDSPETVIKTFATAICGAYNGKVSNIEEYNSIWKDTTKGRNVLKECSDIYSKHVPLESRGNISYIISDKIQGNNERMIRFVAFVNKDNPSKIYNCFAVGIDKVDGKHLIFDCIVSTDPAVRDPELYGLKPQKKTINKANIANTNEEKAEIILRGQDALFTYNSYYDGDIKFTTFEPRWIPERNKNMAGYPRGFLSIVGDEIVIATIRSLDVKGNNMEMKTATLLNAKEVMKKFEEEFEQHKYNSDFDFYVIYKLLIKNDSRGKDAQYGYWNGKDHILPVRVHAAIDDGMRSGDAKNAYTLRGESNDMDKYNQWLSDNSDWDLVITITKDMYKLMSKMNGKKYETQDRYSIGNSQYNKSSSTAKDTFLSFHQAITNKQLRTAYNILSPDYQRFVGSYEKFAPGYDTTISSEIVGLQTVSESSNSAIYSYKLKAVDREGGGTKTQYFAGKAKLIRINGQWRLDSTEAKRL